MADLDLASGLAFPSKECPIPVDFFDPDTRSLVTAGEMVKLFTTRRLEAPAEVLITQRKTLADYAAGTTNC